MQAAGYKDRHFIATIGDEDTITGMLLAGTGHINGKGKKNFIIVDAKTPTATLESAFQEFTERADIAIVLINQHLANQIRPLVEGYQKPFPTVLEIPSKEHPYDPSKDSVLKRVKKLSGD